MSDVVSEVPVTAGSPDPDATAAFGVHAAESPPLTWLTVLAGLAALAINQLALPALGPDVKPDVLIPVIKAGAFATNLAACAGLIALGFGLLVFVRFSQQFALRQRLLLTMFSAAFLISIALATLFEQQQTTAEGVLLAIAAAQVLIGLLGTSAARCAPSHYRRVVALLCTAMGASVLCSQLLQVISQRRVDAWMAPAQHVLQLLGESCYLLLLIVLTPLILPTGADLRSRIARMTGFFLLPLGLVGLYLAERTHQHDYALLLYHAQRVTMWIDAFPRAYSVPLALALAAGISGGLGPHAGRRQAAAGTLLLLASGYAPFSPGRLLTSVLGVLLIARSIIASGQPDGERS